MTTRLQEVYFRLRRIDPTEILNGGEPDAAADADIAGRLRLAINALVGQGIDVETGRVDYARLASSPDFAAYQAAARGLAAFDPAWLTTDAERKAFWINLYNALIIHAVIAYGARRTIREIPAVFDRAAYNVGGRRYSANDIEHGLLRANRGHPFIPGGQFAPDDPRLAHAVATLDPRLHFALVCAAKSCPPIGFYRADRLDAQLDLAARHFINSGQVRLDRATMRVSLSRLFSWYAADFGGALFGYRHQDALLRFIAPYLENSGDCAFVTEHARRLTLVFTRYDWTLNDGIE
jgi:hypothetical protein